MNERVRVTAVNGLRMRDSPRDGITLDVLPNHTELTLLGRETWLRVSRDGKIGFVLADFVEPMHGIAPEVPQAMPGAAHAPAVAYSGAVRIVDYHPVTDVFRGAPLRVDEEFIPCIEHFGQLAQLNQVKIFVTSSLREPGKPVANSIVKPATFSNHHVGHAIDMNILDGDRLIRSDVLGDLGKLARESPGARGFIEAIRAERNVYRWGGDFSASDPVHIDNGLNVFHQKAFAAKLQALWGIVR